MQPKPFRNERVKKNLAANRTVGDLVLKEGLWRWAYAPIHALARKELPESSLLGPKKCVFQTSGLAFDALHHPSRPHELRRKQPQAH